MVCKHGGFVHHAISTPYNSIQQQTPVKHNLPVGWWNAGRLHHLDAHQMPDGRWVALMDGDRGPECPGEYDFVQETCECRPRVVVT